MPNETEGHDHDMKVFPVSNFHCTQKICSSLELKVVVIIELDIF